MRRLGFDGGRSTDFLDFSTDFLDFFMTTARIARSSELLRRLGRGEGNANTSARGTRGMPAQWATAKGSGEGAIARRTAVSSGAKAEIETTGGANVVNGNRGAMNPG